MPAIVAAYTAPLRAALVRYSEGETCATHEHENMTVSVVLGGSLTETVGSRQEEASAGSMVVKPAGTVHSNCFGASGALLLAMSPDGILGDKSVADGWRWHHGSKHLKRCLSVGRALRNGDPWGFAEEELLALVHAPENGLPRHAAPPARLRRVRDEIEALESTRPSVAALARSAGVHPVYLARSFRRFYGCSISEYVRRRRIARAMAMLVERRDLPLATVAQELGFADESHFCRTFSAELGLSPTAYRRAVA
jgi:AraC family transcriptional regulator